MIMNAEKTKRLLIWLGAAFWALALMIYVVAFDQFRYNVVVNDTLSASAVVGEITDGQLLQQKLPVPADTLQSMELMLDTYGRSASGLLHIRLEDEAGRLLAQQSADIAQLPSGMYASIPLAEPLTGLRGQTLFLTLSTEGVAPQNAITFFFGNTVSTGRFDIAKEIPADEVYTLNGQPGVGKLCIRFSGINELSFYRYYWLLVAGVFALLAAYVVRCWKQALAGRNNIVMLLGVVYCRYHFLLKQLVLRDFKAKYKRSVLGVFWSFLNPLLTMTVQYAIFSTMFRSDIPHYPVYLLTGVVFFNFFSEAVSLGMHCITGNASLIKKVYVPKYIYPVTRTLSSSINFLLALIPLVLVMLFTGLHFHLSLLLLIFDLLCMFCFVLGMVMILSTLMTFFQDVQFLWNVISMVWMYATPIFYPESIIPAQFLPLYHMNPLYQYITFARICIINGVSPAPTAYLWCLLSALGVLALGVWLFKKNQDKFILYL